MFLHNRVLTALLEITVVFLYLGILYVGYTTNWSFGL